MIHHFPGQNKAFLDELVEIINQKRQADLSIATPCLPRVDSLSLDDQDQIDNLHSDVIKIVKEI